MSTCRTAVRRRKQAKNDRRFISKITRVRKYSDGSSIRRIGK